MDVTLTVAIEPTREEIARRAYELYERRGRHDGHDVDDWLLAEQELQEARLPASIEMPVGSGAVVGV